MKSTVEPRLSVCGITTRYQTFDEDVGVCCQAGIDGISLWWDKIRHHGIAAGATLLRDAQLPAVSLVGLPSLLSAGAFDTLCEGLDACATLGARVMGVVPGNCEGRSQAHMLGATLEALARLAEQARQRGVTLALEPVHAPYLDYLNTLADADRIVCTVDHPNLGLLFDAWHLCHEADLEARIAQTARRIALVHFSDWREPTRCHDDRLLPGDGVLPLAHWLRHLRRSGYQGYFDVEVFSEDVWRANPLQNLKRCRTFSMTSGPIPARVDGGG